MRDLFEILEGAEIRLSFDNDRESPHFNFEICMTYIYDLYCVYMRDLQDLRECKIPSDELIGQMEKNCCYLYSLPITISSKYSRNHFV